VLVYEQDVLLKARVEVGLQAEFSNDGVVMTVDVCVDPVHPLENLSDKGGKRLGEGHA
jgi:hypothetical protein